MKLAKKITEVLDWKFEKQTLRKVILQYDEAHDIELSNVQDKETGKEQLEQSTPLYANRWWLIDTLWQRLFHIV